MHRQSPKDILQQKEHRPYPYPLHPWLLYQEWSGVLFLHYKVEKELLEPFIPQHVQLDIFDGEAWLSLVPFTVNNAHPRFVPYLPGASNFHEVNLRTYVTDGQRPGITFLDMKANNTFQVLAQRIVGLPYKRSAITRKGRAADQYHLFSGEEQRLDINYTAGPAIAEKNELDIWLTERYCTYQQVNNTTYRYNIHHREWPLQIAALQKADIHYRFHSIQLKDMPVERIQYSPGVSVLFWWREKV